MLVNFVIRKNQQSIEVLRSIKMRSMPNVDDRIIIDDREYIVFSREINCDNGLHTCYLSTKQLYYQQ